MSFEYFCTDMNDVPLLMMCAPRWVIMMCLVYGKEEESDAICIVEKTWLLGEFYGIPPCVY